MSSAVEPRTAREALDPSRQHPRLGRGGDHHPGVLRAVRRDRSPSRSPARPADTTFISWDVFGIVYAALTLLAFGNEDPMALPALLGREASQRSRWKRYLLGGGDGPGFAVSLAVVVSWFLVDVVTTRMRRTVTGHAALAFLFNTVIIALLVSALTR